MKNPYSLMFGKEPFQSIPRLSVKDEVLSSFLSPNPASQVYVLTGIRGSGKTVTLSVLAKEFRNRDDWEVVELNPEIDMMRNLASELASRHAMNSLLKNAKINLSFLGLGAEITGAPPITEYRTAVTRMLETMKNKGKKLLVTVDEVSDNEHTRVFVSDFQIMARQELPVYMLMTGLYENISDLQNEKSLTFFYRAPKIEMTPLNIRTMAASYIEELQISEDEGLAMAKLTKGYPYAFQLLGYLCWDHGTHYSNVLQEFDQYLEEYVYEKIWSELSPGDKKIMLAIAKSQTGKISEIREQLQMETNYFNPYRKRLLRKGLIRGDERGYVRLTLPRFEQYCQAME